jgi:predicted methyltransferase
MMKKPLSPTQFDLSLDEIDLLWSIAKHSRMELTASQQMIRRLEEMDLISLVGGRAALTQSGQALLDSFVEEHSIDTGDFKVEEMIQ